MNRSVFRTLARITIGLVCAVAFTTANVGCAHKNCGPCHSAKNCPPGCTKPCCKKGAQAAVGDPAKPCAKPCDKPCDKKGAQAAGDQGKPADKPADKPGDKK